MALPSRRAKFDRLVAEHLPAALRFAIRLSGRTDLAEEIVQEAMLRAARSWQTFRGESQFRTWLFRIVVNVFRDGAGRRPAHDPLTDDAADPSQGPPSDEAMAAELGELVAQSVAKLPPRQREVLVLSVYEGLAPRQVAAVLGISEANVHTTLSLARARLRRSLASYLAEK